jgi:hypothetical protein
MWEAIDNSPYTMIGAVIFLLITWIIDRWATRRERRN